MSLDQLKWLLSSDKQYSSEMKPCISMYCQHSSVLYSYFVLSVAL